LVAPLVDAKSDSRRCSGHHLAFAQPTQQASPITAAPAMTSWQTSLVPAHRKNNHALYL
jgi:hypothetical protein